MIGWKSMVLAATCCASAASAQEIPQITLEPGEAITVRFDDGGRVGAPERSAAAWTPFDIYAAQQLAGMTPPDAPMPESLPIGAPRDVGPEPIPASQVRIRFLSLAGRHALLVIENGQGRALSYRARMTQDGRTQPTDVCVVLPHLPSYEHWPHPIQRIELSGFRFIPWTAGERPTCE